MKILIVGGGIAGLAIVAFLQKGKHTISIIEKDKQWDRRGYAITLFNNGLQMLQKLHTGNNLATVGHTLNRLRALDKNGNILKDVDYTKVHRKFGPSCIILRKELHSFLREKTKHHVIKMSRTITKLTENDEYVEVLFSDGKHEQFDLVIGADGVASCVRELVFGHDARKFFGLEYWAGLIPPLPSYRPNFPEAVLHKNKAFTVYPYNKTDNLCVTFMKTTSKHDTDEKESSISLLRKTFADMDYVVPNILKLLPTFEDLYHGVLSEVKLKRWYTKRVVLIGDAAHASLPSTGMGTSLALEDAYVLADELDNMKDSSLENALRRFQQRRKKRVTKSQRSAAFYGYLYKFGGDNDITNTLRNMFLKAIPDNRLTSNLASVFAYKI